MTWTVGPQNYMIGRGVVSALTGVPNIDFWQPSTVYPIGSAVLSFDSTSTDGYPLKAYQATAAGTSGTLAGPTGTGAAIADGTLITATTSAASAVGSNILTFTTVPAGVNVGMLVTDATATAAIPAGTTVLAKTTTTVTLSANIVAPGVGSADTIDFPGVTWEYLAPTDVGNCSKFEITISSEYEKHKTSRSGAVVQDFVGEIGRNGGFSATLEEYSLENLALVSYGVISGASPHRLAKLGGQASQNQCWFFRGAGAYGAHYEAVVPRALVHPPKQIGLITEKLANFEMEADVFGMPSDNYAFYYLADIP